MKISLGVLFVAVSGPACADVLRVSESAGGQEGNGESYYVAMSGDGRFVTFSSRASNLISHLVARPSSESQLFLKRLSDGFVELVSVGNNGSQAVTAGESAMNSDGNLVVFSAFANWFPQSNRRLIYLRDRALGKTTLISKNAGGEPANDGCWQPAVSRNGRFVVYVTRSNNLGSYTAGYSVFLYDRLLDSTERISPVFLGGEQLGDCHRPSISDDGRYVVYEAYNREWPNPRRVVLLFDRLRSKTSLVSQANDGRPMLESCKATISGDGTKVAFETPGGPGFPMLPRHQQTNVVVRDLKTGEYTWVNQGSWHGPDNPVFFEPTISGNGRYVTFVDYRSHVPWDVNGEPDVYLRDLHAQTTVRMSEGSLGEPNARSLHTSISDDGSLVAFTSYASNLVTNDLNEVADIFVGPVTR